MLVESTKTGPISLLLPVPPPHQNLLRNSAHDILGIRCYDDLRESFVNPGPQTECSKSDAKLSAIVSLWVTILFETSGDGVGPFNRGENDSVSCASGGRSIATVAKYEHFLGVSDADRDSQEFCNCLFEWRRGRRGLAPNLLRRRVGHLQQRSKLIGSGRGAVYLNFEVVV